MDEPDVVGQTRVVRGLEGGREPTTAVPRHQEGVVLPAVVGAVRAEEQRVAPERALSRRAAATRTSYARWSRSSDVASRWLGATTVLILALSLVVATVAVVVTGLTSQGDEIWAQLEGGCAAPARRAAHGDDGNAALRRDGSDPGRATDLGGGERLSPAR